MGLGSVFKKAIVNPTKAVYKGLGSAVGIGGGDDKGLLESAAGVVGGLPVGALSQLFGQMMGGAGGDPGGAIAAGLTRGAFGTNPDGGLMFNMAPGTIQGVLGGMPQSGYGAARLGISGGPMQTKRISAFGA